jgi:hypothetical protein
MTVQNHLTPNGSQQRLDSISFWIKGSAKFIFNQGNYALRKKNAFIQPTKELPLNLELAPNSWVISVIVSIKKFHALFSTEANYITLSGTIKTRNTTTKEI